MTAPRYPLAADSFGDAEIAAAVAVLKSGRYTMGGMVAAFEKALAAWTGAGHAVMVNSGSSANLLIVDSLLRRSAGHAPSLEPGDEVLVPALAWPTTVWPIVQLGLVPVFVDIDPATLAISLEAAAGALSPRTRALFLIHVLGRAAGMTAVSEFCRRHRLVLIEDCCESLGAFDDGRHVGTFGFGGTLSHFYSHHLTTMEGGTLITDDAALADDWRSARAHGWIRDRSDRVALQEQHPGFDPRFLFVMPGYNVRPTEIQGAIGLAQIDRLDTMLERREANARRVEELIRRHTPWLEIIGGDCLTARPAAAGGGVAAGPKRPAAGAEVPAGRAARRHSWMNIPIRVLPAAPIDARGAQAALEAAGVETRPIIAGNLARHPACAAIRARISGSLAAADAVLAGGFMIGCPPDVDEARLAVLEAGLRAVARARD